MAFNRPFSGNGRFNRGGNQGNQGGGNFRRGGNQQDASETPDYRGIAWGNKFRDQQNVGAPVLQGYATVNGQKLRLVGFLNPRPEDRENAEAQEYKEQIAAEINAILVEAQESFGIAFNLTFQDEEEWKAERDNASRGGNRNFQRAGGRGASPQPPQQQFRNNRAPQAQQNIPFNNQSNDDTGGDPEPEASPRPAAKPRTSRATAAKPTAPAKRATRKK